MGRARPKDKVVNLGMVWNIFLISKFIQILFAVFSKLLWGGVNCFSNAKIHWMNG